MVDGRLLLDCICSGWRLRDDGIAEIFEDLLEEREGTLHILGMHQLRALLGSQVRTVLEGLLEEAGVVAVSYTHLTLPTIGG